MPPHPHRTRAARAAALASVALVAVLGLGCSATIVVEGESMTRPAGATVGTESGVTYLTLGVNGEATARVTAPTSDGLVLRARGTACAGAPRAVVKLDGATVADAEVGTAWSDVRIATPVTGGAHDLRVDYTNDYATSTCNRNLDIDKIAFYTLDGPKPTGTAEAALAASDPAVQPYRFGGPFAGALNEPIPAGAALDPRSATVTGDMVASMRRARVRLQQEDGVPGVWVAGPQDPFFTIHANGQTLRWRVPAGVTAGGVSGADAPVVILDPSHPDYGPESELRLFRAQIDRTARTITAEGHGVFHYGHTSDGRAVEGWGTGWGLSWAGLVRGSEVRTGEVNHALRMTAPAISARWRAPAIKSDQSGDRPLEMGMRLQLDPAVDCDTRTVPGRSATGPETRLLRMLCRALQRYGAVVTDGSGMADLYSVLMELDTKAGGTADWSSIAGSPPNGLWGNVIRDQNANATGDGVVRSATDGIPWARMRVLAAGTFSG